MRKVMMVRPELCDDCQDCEKACAQLHGASRIHISKLDDGFRLAMSCQQCEIPVCHKVCPIKRASAMQDGVVVINREECIGCGLCIQTCPFGAMEFHPALGVAEKCDLCHDEPFQACVKACTKMCLEILSPAEVASRRREDISLIYDLVTGKKPGESYSYMDLIFTR